MDALNLEIFRSQARAVKDMDILRGMIEEKKALLLINAENEKWNQVILLANQLNLLQDEYLDRLRQISFNIGF